jgi:hypothetical protein
MRTSKQPTYRETFDLPAWAAPQWNGPPGDRELVNEGEIKWSGIEAPPALESTVTLYTTGATPATGRVCAYFIEHNWLGILVALANPPTWWVEQNNGANPPFHAFGLDLTRRNINAHRTIAL